MMVDLLMIRLLDLAEVLGLMEKVRSVINVTDIWVNVPFTASMKAI